MIPVFRPAVSQAEIDAVERVLRSGWWGAGPATQAFEERFAASIGARRVIGMSSATAAIHLALVAFGVGGREVITAALTFVGANHSIIHAGARPVFADVEPDTLTLDPADVERRLRPATAAILVTDYGGHPADLDALRSLARGRGIPLIEDAAHSVGARIGDRPVGSLADVTCFSFQVVKNLAMGEGGAVATDDEALAERLRRLRWFGIDRDTWARTSGAGYAWDYDVHEFGFKAHLSDVAAAIGLVQLERLAELNGARRRLAERYRTAFADLDWLTLPIERPGVHSSWHLFVVRLDDRDALISHLAANDIVSSVHYRPSTWLSVYRPYATDLPVTDREWRRLVTLPLFPDLSDADQDRVIDAVRAFSPRPAIPAGSR